jgi:aspartyl-tRNA synthetase
MKLQSIYRTHSCAEPRPELVGQTITLSGWINRKRDHGGVLFVDLRDNYGVTQVVFSGEQLDTIQKIRLESVIQVTGELVQRSAELVNSAIATGEVELAVKDFTILSSCEILPFQIAEEDGAPEITRLTYRFLELRREELRNTIKLRGEVIHTIRNLMRELGFREFQTPILTSSSPEGARDFLVPSRRHPGKFFALPQAPQIFKQLLMVAGFDRYFQIAPCFRDEDPRADRSPGEFYQCDLEMSFVEQDDVLKVGEALFSRVFAEFSDRPVTPTPFPRLPYFEAIERFGTDKPDLRIPIEIVNATQVFRDTSFRVFQNVLAEDGIVAALALPLEEFPPRKYLDDTVAYFQNISGTGLGYLLVDQESHKGSIAKFVSEEEVAGLRKLCPIEKPTVIFLAAGKNRSIQIPLGKLRIKLAQDHSLITDDGYRFTWIVDMPLYEADEETGKIDFSHNPFSMPQGGPQALEIENPLEIKGYQYDLVCNGYELVSGAIRNHLPELMYKVFGLAGYPQEEVDRQFSALINAFKFGAPPHGGMAAGIDRIIMLLSDKTAIRDVMPFPLAQSTEDLMMKAPSIASPQQLEELCLQINLPPEDDEQAAG